MPTKRKSISKKTRFEVFKRDGFKCQYCGSMAPEAVLVVDHIDPVSKDGAHDMMNFITACQPCNSGKSDRRLSDSTTLQKQKAQLQELSERREQLEMMLRWREGLQEITEYQVETIGSAWSEAVPGWHLNETGLKTARVYLKQHGLPAVLDAIETAKLQYVKVSPEDGKAQKESVELAWQKVGGILRLAALPEDRRRLYYVKGILRNRMAYVPYDVMTHLEAALEAGVDVEKIVIEAKRARNWTAFYNWLLG